jgi:hypothetical protein
MPGALATAQADCPSMPTTGYFGGMGMLFGVFLDAEYLPNLLQRFVPVRTHPVDPVAAAAGFEVALRFRDVGRDPSPYFGEIDGFERLVAPQTSSHDAAKRRDGEVRRHLPELILKVVAPNEEMVVPRFATPDQFRIARQDYPTGPGCLIDQVFIRYLREILDVASQEAQPRGQLSEHDVCDESGLRRHTFTSLGSAPG